VFDRDGGLHGSASPGQPHENLANKEGLLRSRPVRCDPADGAFDVTVPGLVCGLRPAGGVVGPGADSARDANWTAAGYAWTQFGGRGGEQLASRGRIRNRALRPARWRQRNHRVRATANEPSGYHDRPQRGGRPAWTRSARTLEVRTLCEPGDVDHGRLAL